MEKLKIKNLILPQSLDLKNKCTEPWQKIAQSAEFSSFWYNLSELKNIDCLIMHAWLSYSKVKLKFCPLLSVILES